MYSLIVAVEKEKIVKESINGKNETRYKSIMYEAILRLYVGLLRL
ncbi:transcriptional regulator [Bacillus toyonensis]|nr:transcriptional regulator [Bacillus toyonensis]PEJ59770.1 transcriptional regulator [Bacillus toyonensis]PEL53898.1 transcriptional regulator [Bacillus toyonensis]PEM91115.1 transcriptional regulator [Bacillus toyonensis]PEN63130.1 transcriptional regulator [Bacillus toyonensis]